jgi:hypothetical protein
MSTREGLIQQHRSISLAIEELRSRESFYASELPGDISAQVEQHLLSFEATLLEHFHREEAGGYMSAVLAQSPHLSPRITELALQHTELREMLKTIISGYCRTSITAEPGRLLLSFLDALRAHETQENRLLQEAWCVDQGTAD